MIQATRDEEHNRLRRSLAVSFSEKSMKQMEPRVKGWVQLLQAKLAERGGAEVDMVELFRCAVSPSKYQHSLVRVLAYIPSKESLRLDLRCHFG
jgi:hypothetical protein